ncbi:hypothetical protein CCZ01_08075 [Helicobacter monodelphidis]|uniref:hypothetical protein n=1 Tax=Helicobacter sp. 15-1451 TaxID=2004995 RepID=UPI000DCF07A1|nr:hypothetical protein [Helicobacter sp. 15-1451]RAX56887.1 hypothetical protein CCZ01_08075 [Helicobacter sp. 15-1451]
MGFYKEDYQVLDFLKESGYIKEGASVIECASQDLKEDRDGVSLEVANQRHSPMPIYQEYGFKTYQCIDMDGGHNALKFDLGLDLAKEYNFQEQFDLVTCRESGHWIFDQKQLFTNLHNLCKQNGIIVWRSPLAGGFAQSFYTYNFESILKLAFVNDYLLLGGFITENFYFRQGGGFGLKRKVAELIEGSNATEFTQFIEKYMDRKDSWRHLLIEDGYPVVMPTLIFLKQGNKPFKVPLFYYDNYEKIVTRNAKNVLQNCFPKVKFGNIAIFGAGYNGGLAYNFAKASGLNVSCVIDDIQKGVASFCKHGEMIVSFDEFVKSYQSECDFILVGPWQKGSIEGRGGLNVPTYTINLRWFI